MMQNATRSFIAYLISYLLIIAYFVICGLLAGCQTAQPVISPVEVSLADLVGTRYVQSSITDEATSTTAHAAGIGTMTFVQSRGMTNDGLTTSTVIVQMEKGSAIEAAKAAAMLEDRRGATADRSNTLMGALIGAGLSMLTAAEPGTAALMTGGGALAGSLLDREPGEGDGTRTEAED